MQQLSRKRGYYAQQFVLSLITFIIFCSITPLVSQNNVYAAQIFNATEEPDISSICPVSIKPGNNALLIALLDRSGSLVEGSKPTDPDGYSTSVTSALADLWPGRMAVIPFSGVNTQLPIFGPYTLSDPTQLAKLQSQIRSYPIQGDTPMDTAMREGLALLHQYGNPPGSRVILITDGSPTGIGKNDGIQQEQNIRAQLISQFCHAGIPISTFGLTINPKTAAGQDANRLLSDIAGGTGADYTNVTTTENLANEVINLYGNWLGLSFTQIKQVQNDNFPIAVDPFAQKVIIISFRSSSQYPITLFGPNGQPFTKGTQISTDPHYQIDTLIVSGTVSAGTYTVNTGGDLDAQVYELVISPLNVRLVAPVVGSDPYDNQPVYIKAEFVNGQDILTPASGQAQIIASVTLIANGRPVIGTGNDIQLKQQGNTAIFRGQTIVYGKPGDLHIEINAIYQQGEKRETSFDLPLIQPLPIPFTCSLSNPQCIIQQDWVYMLGITLFLAVLMFIFLSGRRRKQKGSFSPFA